MTAVGVLFDMDGVLVDSAHLHLRAYERVFRDVERPFPEAAREAVFQGKPRRQVLDLALPTASSALKAQLFDAKPAALDELLNEEGECGMPGASETVRTLSKAGIRLAVVTNSRSPQVWLEKLGIVELIQVLVTGSDVGSAKPSPEGYLLGAERLGIDPALCLAVEDSRDGWLAASQAGMQVALLASERPAWLEPEAWWLRRLDSAQIQSRLDSVR